MYYYIIASDDETCDIYVQDVDFIEGLSPQDAFDAVAAMGCYSEITVCVA
jgi:hypothetical protein